MKITDLIIDNRSLGSKLWLVDVVPAYEYKNNARTDTVLGYRYTIALPEKGLEKINVRIDGKQLMEAFKSLGGRIRNREAGRYEIISVPYAVRSRDMVIGAGQPVLNRYERICFDKKFCTVQGQPQAELICPGHPLLNAIIHLIREKSADVMKRGAILVDDSDYSTNAKLLFYIEDSVQDGVLVDDKKRRTISKHIHFVEIMADGRASTAGYAPYLDYRAVNEAEYDVIRAWANAQSWLSRDVEAVAKGYAVEHLVPAHFAEVKQRREAMLNKTAKAVKDRLTAEIQYWDYRAIDLKEKEAAGKTNNKLNSMLAERRAEELQNRMISRLAEIERERRISPMPPVVTGGALVIPRGLLHQLMPHSAADSFGHGDRQAVEYAAMDAVMQIEKAMGYRPKDVSATKCGYDIESFVPENLRGAEGNVLRFVEVKGRKKGADTVTVTRNEILCGLTNPEQFILAIVEVDGMCTNTVYLKNPFTSIPMMASHGVLYAKAGVVHLLERADLPERVDINESNIWLLTQQLTHAMTKGGVEACAKHVADIFGSNAESAKDLAYRLYTIAERKGWTEEAYAYNALVVAWPDIQSRAADLKARTPEQMTLF